MSRFVRYLWNGAGLPLGLLVLWAAGCKDTAPAPDVGPNPQLYAPYLTTSAWDSNHGNPYNSDYSFVDPPLKFELRWHGLQGSAALVAPVLDEARGLLFVPTGRSGQPNLHAFRLQDPGGGGGWDGIDEGGAPAPSFGALTGAAIVDEQGDVYVGDEAYLWSFTSDGVLRWKAPLPIEHDGEQERHAPLVTPIFVQSGQVGGVTTAGRVVLFERSTGALAADLQLDGVLPVTPVGDPAGVPPLVVSLMRECLWHDADGGLMMDEGLLEGYVAGFFGVGMAVANTPAAVPAPDDPEGTSTRIYVPAVMETADASASHDVKLLRVDVRADPATGALTVTPQPAFEALLPGGEGSATSPTVTADGDAVFVGDAHGMLYAFDAEDGSERWRVQVGPMMGSVTVDWPESRTVYVGSDETITALDAQSGEVRWQTRYDGLAASLLEPLQERPPVAVVAGIVLATPSRLLVPLTVGYRLDDLLGDAFFVWPMRSVIAVLDKQGSVLGTSELPDVVETPTVLTSDRSLLVSFGSTVSSMAHCLWQNYGNTLANGLPEPLVPVGGVALLRPKP